VTLAVELREVPFRAPFATANGVMRRRQLLQVRLTDGDGLTGVGEAAPLEPYDGVTVRDVEAALEAWPGSGPLPDLPQAAAAIDLARWDLAGRRAGEPVWKLLGAPAPGPVTVNATISGEEPQVAAAQAQAAVARGFTCLKLKVGTGEDFARAHAVREAVGPSVAIRIDANGAWSTAQAVAALTALGPLGIELCEEPVHGVEALARVAAATAVPVAADETTADPAIFVKRACAAVCLKISSSGGITGVVRDAQRARAAGYDVYLASTFDGPLGIAAALHAAAFIDPDRACGLATLAQLDLPDPFPPKNGGMTAPDGPGLGVPAVS
jgi:L-Ala-D/L-Glu epimerase